MKLIWLNKFEYDNYGIKYYTGPAMELNDEENNKILSYYYHDTRNVHEAIKYIICIQNNYCSAIIFLKHKKQYNYIDGKTLYLSVIQKLNKELNEFNLVKQI